MPESSTARRLLDFSRLFAAGDYEAAAALIDALAADNPNEGPIHWQRARTLEKLERYGEARAAVKRVLELRREFAPAWVLRAELGEEEGDYDPEPDLRRAIALDPKLGRARYALALLLKDDEDRDDEALVQMDTALELDPALHEAYAARAGWSRIAAWTGAASRKVAHLERALADFDRAIEVEPLPGYRFARADLLHQLQRYGEAVIELDVLIAVLPPVHELHGLALDARKRAEEQAPGTQQAPVAKATPRFVPVDPSRYPAHQREHERKVTRELGQQGFRKLGDYDAVHLADAMEHRPMITLYVRDDGWATATAFCLKPDWPGLVGGLAMMAKGEYRAVEVVEFGTTFSDGATLSTSGTYDAHVTTVRAHLAARHGLAIRKLQTLEEVSLQLTELTLAGIEE